MADVGFETVLDEAEKAGEIRMMKTLTRDKLFIGSANRCNTLMITDDALFLSAAGEEDEVVRIPKKSVISAKKAGFLFWESVRLDYLDLEGEKTIYVCPISGAASLPKKDVSAMDELINIFKVRR
jgi:hypothetical protein